MNMAVFVNSLVKQPNGTVTIEASNGGPEGPPFVRWSVPTHYAHNIRIGQRFFMIITKSEG